MTNPSDSLEAFVPAAPRFLLFTGKGGAGKTTLSGANTLSLSDCGRRGVRDTLGSQIEESCRAGCGN